MDNKLDFSSLTKALTSLKEAWAEYQKDTKNLFVRDSVIQRFEYTYELSFKMIKRFLKHAEANPLQIDGMFFTEVIRTANKKGIVKNNVEKWSTYRNARNVTSHAYDGVKAEELISVIADFISDADYIVESFTTKEKERAEGEKKKVEGENNKIEETPN